MFSIFGSTSPASGPLAYRLGVIERKLDLVLKALGVEYRDDLADQLAKLVAEGRKIEAIKIYRERTGVGLKEAKDAVEAMTWRGTST
jgi:hypothetical protein